MNFQKFKQIFIDVQIMSVLYKQICLAILGCFFLNTVFAETFLIIKYKPNQIQAKELANGKLAVNELIIQQMQPLTNSQIKQISSLSGIKFKEVNQIGNGAHVLRLDRNLNKDQLQHIIEKIQTDPNIEYVEEDTISQPISTPQSINQAQGV